MHRKAFLKILPKDMFIDFKREDRGEREALM